MPVDIAAMGVGVVGQHMAGNQAAEAAGQMAQAQANATLQSQRETRSIAQGYSEKAIGAAAPTAQELAMLNAQQGSAERATARQEALFASIDPALMAAGKQALGLLQGQSSPLLNPMLQERQRERAALQGKLQGQLGSAYASSSAGSEALNRFDQQTMQASAQIQQQTLGQLMGAATQGVGTEAGANAATAGFYNPTLGAAQGIQNRQIGAYNTAAQTIMGTDYSGAAGQAAAAPYVQNYAQAQNMGQTYGNIGKFGASMFGAEMGMAQGAMGGGGGDKGGGGSGSYGNNGAMK